MKRQQLITLSLLMMFLCIFIFAFIFLWLNIFIHDYNLFRLEAEFSRLSVPSNTYLIKKVNRIGNLIANGNHCDYLVANIRSYNCSKEFIINFYKNKKLYNPITKNYEALNVLFVDELNKIDTSQNSYMSIPFPLLDLRNVYTNKNYYIIYFFDSGYDAGIDIRCM